MTAQLIAAASKSKDWTVDVPEIGTMAASLGAQHGADVMNLACMVQLSQSLMRHFGAAHGSNLEALIKLQWDCVRAFADEKEINIDAVVSALAGIDRAGKTAHYISQIPN